MSGAKPPRMVNAEGEAHHYNRGLHLGGGHFSDGRSDWTPEHANSALNTTSAARAESKSSNFTMKNNG